jgi:hypothetical protein
VLWKLLGFDSSGESHSGGPHENSSKLSEKSLVNPKARKRSLSSQHHLFSSHATDASNGRKFFVAYGHFQADFQPTRPIPDHYRGHNAYMPEDNDIRRESFAANGRFYLWRMEAVVRYT